MWRYLILLPIATAMLIPEDTEFLEEFLPAIPQYSPQDDYSEVRSLTADAFLKSIRNKRSARINDLLSTVERREAHRFLRRQRREAEKEKKTNASTAADEKKRSATPMKLAKNSDGFAPARDMPTAAALRSSKWARSPFEYSKVQHEEDSMALDSTSTANEGMKTRTPRVNFVTQQKKSLDHDSNKAGVTKSELYKSPPLLHNNKENMAAATSSSDRYPDRSSTPKPSTYDYKDYKERDRDPNANRYDDRYLDDMYPPPINQYDEAMYDPYYGPPNQRQPYSYYGRDYPALPDYRDYPPPYANEIDGRYYGREMPANNQNDYPRRRMIYYAYLPEVVRSPPMVDLRYRSYDRFDQYDPYYGDHYDRYDSYMGGRNSGYRQRYPERMPAYDKAPMRTDTANSRPSRSYY